MTVHSPIVAAQPNPSLAAPPPILTKVTHNDETAVDAVLTAIDDMPADIADGTLEDLTGPVIGKDPYPLPPLPIGVSPKLAALVARYESEFLDERPRDAEHADDDRWEPVAREIAKFVPASAADRAVKLMYGLHYLHPAQIGNLLAIDTECFEANTAGVILIATMHTLLAEADATTRQLSQSVLSEWGRLMADWQASHDEYERLSKVQGEAEQRFFAALPEKPTRPELGDAAAILNMTIAEIKAGAIDNQPAWKEYDAKVAAWTAERAAISVSSGLEAAENASQEALDRRFELTKALLAIPAPDHTYVFKKLGIIQKEFGSFEDPEMEFILADVARLSGEPFSEQPAPQVH